MATEACHARPFDTGVPIGVQSSHIDKALLLYALQYEPDVQQARIAAHVEDDDNGLPDSVDASMLLKL